MKGEMVPAYVILDIEILDPAGYEEYRRLSAGTAERAGGRMLALSDRAEPLEGDWRPHRLVVLRFDDREQALRWWTSEEYQRARRVRERTARTSTILVDGL